MEPLRREDANNNAEKHHGPFRHGIRRIPLLLVRPCQTDNTADGNTGARRRADSTNRHEDRAHRPQKSRRPLVNPVRDNSRCSRNRRCPPRGFGIAVWSLSHNASLIARMPRSILARDSFRVSTRSVLVEAEYASESPLPSRNGLWCHRLRKTYYLRGRIEYGIP